MDTEFLESFVVVAEYGSVAEAARRLNLTAAAVTQRLHALEREIGTALVVRSGRNMRPTEAGTAMLAHARHLLRTVRDLSAVANERVFAGELRLGAVPSALTGVMPPILSGLAEKHPLITLYIFPATSLDLYHRVLDGELDAAVIVEPQFPLPKTCGWATWREEDLVVLAHREVRQLNPHEVLAHEPFIRYDRNRGGGRLADDYLQQAGITPKGHYELDSLAAIAVMVDRGLGVSLVPDWAPPWPSGLMLTKLPLPDSSAKRRIGLLWRRSSARLRLVQALISEADQDLMGRTVTTPTP